MISKYLFILFCGLCVVAAAFSVLRLKATTANKVWVQTFGFILLAVGGLGFIAPLLCATGLLKLSDDTEWPVGSARRTFTAKNGEHVVLVEAASRIQVYDPNWRFRNGWRISPGEKGFDLRLGSETNVEVITRHQRFVYSLNGELISQGEYAPQQLHDSHKSGESAIVPTHWSLWVLTSPAHSWIVAALGGGLLFLCNRKQNPKLV